MRIVGGEDWLMGVQWRMEGEGGKGAERKVSKLWKRGQGRRENQAMFSPFKYDISLQRPNFKHF